MLSLHSLKHADFEPRLQDVFHVRNGSEILPLKLIDIKPLGEASAATRAPFSLLFLGPARNILAQRTYPLEHPALGNLEIFLVPVGRDETGLRYEAVFT